jgi:hypothetical protein
MYEKTSHEKRYQRIFSFLKRHIYKQSKILELGVENPFSNFLKSKGFKIENTNGEDLDEDFSAVLDTDAEVITTFEILEHLLSPYVLLKEIKAKKLLISVPLKLWFLSAYRSSTDFRDRHFHEFEAWQLDWLLEKIGWTIIASDKWTNPTKKIGIRTLFRFFVPRYYIVYAEKRN